METPFDTAEFLRATRQALKESVVYFEHANLPERERWVACELLRNFDLEFDQSGIRSSTEDPPDVLFRDAKFEVKELMDPGRERHKELKLAAARAEGVTDPQDLLTPYTPKGITPTEVAGLVAERLDELQLKYPQAVRQSLDCLIYVNLVEHVLEAGPMPPPADFAKFRWRSISAVFGWDSLVFSAGTDAPTFLRERCGQLLHRSGAVGI
jgi:hypothetical protein